MACRPRTTFRCKKVGLADRPKAGLHKPCPTGTSNVEERVVAFNGLGTSTLKRFRP